MTRAWTFIKRTFLDVLTQYVTPVTKCVTPVTQDYSNRMDGNRSDNYTLFCNCSGHKHTNSRQRKASDTRTSINYKIVNFDVTTSNHNRKTRVTGVTSNKCDNSIYTVYFASLQYRQHISTSCVQYSLYQHRLKRHLPKLLELRTSSQTK